MESFLESRFVTKAFIAAAKAVLVAATEKAGWCT